MRAAPKVEVSTIGFRLSGIEPDTDLAWYFAGPSGQLEFWGEVGRIGAMVKRRSLSAGLDRFGRRMAQLHPWTKEDRDNDINSVTGRKPYSPMGRATAKNPQLQATGAKSRTRTLLRFVAEKQGVWFYWGRDPHTGMDWGVILARHARGFFQRFYRGTGYVPPRDVIGLSQQDIREITVHMRAWWARKRIMLALLGRSRREAILDAAPEPETLAPEPGRSPHKKPTPVQAKPAAPYKPKPGRVINPTRVQNFALPNRRLDSRVATFMSPAQRTAHLAAVARGNAGVTNVGGVTRTTKRLRER